MNKLEPVITEKTMSLASEGKYTFRVDRNLNKYKIKKLIEDTFGVKVTGVHTMNEPGEIKITLAGRKRVIQPQKKAVVKLAEKEKIDLFEESKK